MLRGVRAAQGVSTGGSHSVLLEENVKFLDREARRHQQLDDWRGEVASARDPFLHRVEPSSHRRYSPKQAPHISGIEATFEDGELAFGSMPNARKGANLRPDPRFALHSATVDPVEGSEAQWPGEAKISGRATHVGPTTEGSDEDLFHTDITEVVHTHLNVDASKLVVRW